MMQEESLLTDGVWECELLCLIIWGGSAAVLVAGGGWCWEWEASLLGR